MVLFQCPTNHGNLHYRPASIDFRQYKLKFAYESLAKVPKIRCPVCVKGVGYTILGCPTIPFN